MPRFVRDNGTNQTKEGPGVENPHPRSFWCSMLGVSCVDADHTQPTYMTHHTHFDANEYYTYACSEYHVRIPTTQNPLTEQIKLNTFGSPDDPVFLDSLLSYGDSVYSHGTLFEILGTPEKTCLTCMGTPVKTCWKFWQSGRAASAEAAARHSQHARAHTESPPKIISVQAKPKFRKCEFSQLNPNVKKPKIGILELF